MARVFLNLFTRSVMDHEFRNEYGLIVLRQPTIPVVWRELKMDLGFRPDMIVENKVIVELKSVETVAPVHYKQLLTYLRLTGMKLGLLINFNEELIKNGIKKSSKRSVAVLVAP